MSPHDNRIGPAGNGADSKTTVQAIASILAEDERHAAFLAGYDLGLAEGCQQASMDLARGILHAEARLWTNAAVMSAGLKHGPSWAAEIGRQAASGEAR